VANHDRAKLASSNPSMKKLILKILFPFSIFIINCITVIAQSAIGTPANCFCNAVSIITQPSSPSPNCPAGGASVITVTVNGTGPFTYRWQENMNDIADNGTYSGTATATLTITNPPVTLNGKAYRCIVTNCSGKKIAITNNSAVLTVSTIPADINMDGITDVGDFAQFIQSFNIGCIGCPEDINSDGLVNVNDFLQLVSQFNKACK
jgi:hypothetical protein